MATYLTLHRTLMIAMARAGVTVLEQAPKEPESARSDSTDYVEACFSYRGANASAQYDRTAKGAVGHPFKIPRAARPMCVRVAAVECSGVDQQRDEEERALWVERHRHTASPLGKIVKASLAICARANALFTSSVARRSCSTSAATCGKSQRRRVCVTRLSGCVRSRRPSSPGGTQQEARTTRLQRSSWRKL